MDITFPSSSKKSILSKTKNITIRVNDEIGKYKKGSIYQVKLDNGKDLSIQIKVIEVTLSQVWKLPSLGIPKKSIESLKKKEHLTNNSLVEFVQFEVI